MGERQMNLEGSQLKCAPDVDAGKQVEREFALEVECRVAADVHRSAEPDLVVVESEDIAVFEPSQWF